MYLTFRWRGVVDLLQESLQPVRTANKKMMQYEKGHRADLDMDLEGNEIIGG